MIKLQLLTEGRYDYGCVMARIDEKAARVILDFNYKTIGENMIYEEEGHDYGREVQPHITLKYGLVGSYTEDQMKQLLQHVIPFDVKVTGMSVFENDKYDVIKFDVDGKELHELNKLFSSLPNHDEHPEYHPHLTLAYVHKGMGKKFIKKPSKTARIPVRMLEYSDKGVKSYYNLQEMVNKIPSQMYHGTTEKLSNRVWKYGLEPGNLRNHPKYENKNGVYLTTNPEVALHFGGAADPRDNVVMLTVDTSKLDPKRFEIDQASPNSYIYMGNIPANKIIDWKIIDDKGRVGH